MAYNSLFSKTPAIFCDQYAYTMGAADFNASELDRISTSQVFFRQLINNGFKDGNGKELKIPYLVVAGLGPFFEWLDNWKLDDEQAAYLATLKAGNGARLYPDEYIEHLKTHGLEVDIDAMPEGELAFPDEPVVRITGPHYQVQMVEAALLNLNTAQTGWATIGSQFWLAAQRFSKHASLYEFAARRTPEWGGLGTARSAYIAGWDATSNLYAGMVYGIPTFGTMAHAFIMVRENEVDAFAAWAKNMPNSGVFLVDTYDTIEGIRKAIEVCKKYGVKLQGVRLDSGDMAYLSRIAREELDKAGFQDAIVIASDGLSVSAIHQIYQVQESPLNALAVGGNYASRRQDTEGVTAVMKAARVAGRDLMKFSNTAEKATFPGVVDVVRYIETDRMGDKYFAGDTIIPAGLDIGDGKLGREIISIPRRNPTGAKPFPEGVEFYRPIIPVMRGGKHLIPEFQRQDAKAIVQMGRQRFFRSMKMLSPDHKNIVSPRLYIAGVEDELLNRQAQMVRDNVVTTQRRRQLDRFALNAA